MTHLPCPQIEAVQTNVQGAPHLTEAAMSCGGDRVA
jgi:FlaA1/EpsC-like NDP-sugar epimerase